jgi:pre-mRNA-processing factor SLU7
MFFPFFQDTGKEAEQVAYAGENIVRFSGDTSKQAQAQLFAWEAQHAGVDVHLLAEPTKAEKLKVACVGKRFHLKSSFLLKRNSTWSTLELGKLLKGLRNQL